MISVATLSNGRTYAQVSDYKVTGNSTPSMMELTSSGLRLDMAYASPNNFAWLNSDGSLIYGSIIGSGTTSQFDQLPMTGFDTSGNPQYPFLANAWARCRRCRHGMPSTAALNQSYHAPFFAQMANGLLVTYDPQGQGAGMHLGAVNPATGLWQWQTMLASGPLDGQGNFDTNNWYGGNRVMAERHECHRRL